MILDDCIVTERRESVSGCSSEAAGAEMRRERVLETRGNVLDTGTGSPVTVFTFTRDCAGAVCYPHLSTHWPVPPVYILMAHTTHFL